MRILLIDHHPEHAERIRQGLQAHTYAVDWVTTADEGQRLAKTEDYDVIIARDELGEVDAVKVTRQLRRADVEDPVMVLAGDTETDTVVNALDAGADQVMADDRAFRELLARVRAMLRQCKPTPGDTLTYRDVVLDLPRLSVSRDGRPLCLVGKPFALLEFFMRNPERVLSRNEIGQAVWDRNFDPFSNVIDVTVSKIRQQLDKPFGKSYLHTIVGAGYMLSATAPGQGGWG